MRLISNINLIEIAKICMFEFCTPVIMFQFSVVMEITLTEVYKTA